MTSPPPHIAPSPAQAPASSTPVTVRHDIRGRLKVGLVLLAVAALVLFWFPALIVLVRREAAYFTNGILATALIATAALLVVGTSVIWLLARRGGPILLIDADGVRIPAHGKRAELTAQWSELALIRHIGRTEPALAFYLRETDEPETAEPPRTDDLDLSEPEFLRPLNFEADPPPPMRLPDAATFDRITPLPRDDKPEQAIEQPAPKPGAALHGTPYVVSLARTTPSQAEVLRAIARFSAGRVALG